MNTPKRIFRMMPSLILLAGWMISGCSLPFSNPSVQETNRALTLTAQVPTDEHTVNTLAPTSPLADTPTLLPSSTVIPTGTPPPTSTNPPVPSATTIPCYQAKFIADISIPDDTKLPPGMDFIKTWRIWNTGYCNWDTDMLIFFDNGTLMSKAKEYYLDKAVPSGEMVNISLAMKAPEEPGTYMSSWRFKSPKGDLFGVGDQNIPFYTRIIVEPTGFRVTSVKVTAEETSFSGACPPGHSFTFKGKITTSALGRVTYYWVFSDGTQSALSSLEFTGPETKNVSTSWVVNSSMTGNARIYIDSPNHQLFQPGASFSMTCSP